MRKRRFLYLIFSLIALIFLTALSITYENSYLCFLLMIIVMIPNHLIKNKERQITNEIISKYGFECEPYQYIESLMDYSKHCFLTKKQKLVYELYYALAYLDAGDFEEVKDILLEIDKQTYKLDEMTKVLYLKAWCDYFFYNHQDEKMKLTLLKMKDIITYTRFNHFMNNYSIIYMLLEAKYYILTDTNLSRAKELFKNRKSLIPTKLSLIGSNYQMALLDIREKNYTAAKEKLKLVASKNENLYIVRDARKLLDDIDNLVL